MPNSSACHAYLMWAELDHCHFLYVHSLRLLTNDNDVSTNSCFFRVAAYLLIPLTSHVLCKHSNVIASVLA